MNSRRSSSAYRAALRDAMDAVNDVIAEHQLLCEHFRDCGETSFVADVARGSLGVACQIGRRISLMIDDVGADHRGAP